MINGVIQTPLKQICDDRGKICHMLKRTDPYFKEFGEIYFSFINPGIVKAWHWHDKMTLNYAVPLGMIKLVLYDDRSDSPTYHVIDEYVIGEYNYILITVPPHVWNGFMCIGPNIAMVANCATLPHDPKEIKRIDAFDKQIPYSWDIKMR